MSALAGQFEPTICEILFINGLEGAIVSKISTISVAAAGPTPGISPSAQTIFDTTASELPLPRSSRQESYLIAQTFDQDVLGDIKTGFDNFIESGQVWALLIGLVVGYVIRGLTR